MNDQRLWFGVVSLFPDMFKVFTEQGVFGRAVRRGLIGFNCWDPRDYTRDKHRTVDDRPYGGGPGMLMMVEPLQAAIHAAKLAAGSEATVVYLSPQGRKLDHQGVLELASHRRLVLVAGRYEGIDERVITTEIDQEWSIGDYVLSGGELPALTLMDAVARQVPGVLGHQQSATQDSFADGLLDYPHYTRPEVLDDKKVPSVLLSGDHQAIRIWRLTESLRRTWLKRPELLNNLALTEEQVKILDEIKASQIVPDSDDC